MENVGFSGSSGEDIERALMDLGPFLGVSIKEEVSDELGEVNPASRSAPVNTMGAEGVMPTAEGGGATVKSMEVPEREGERDGDGADSLESPSNTRDALATLRCIFCHTALVQTEGTPKLMECLHSACEPCIKTKIEEKQSSNRDFLGAERISITCTECRLHCQQSNMIDQRFILEKMALEQAGSGAGTLSGEQQCNSCEDTEPATSYCVDCAEFICDNCVQAHQRLKITKDHTIKSKEEAVAELQAAQGVTRSAHDMYCRDHPQERLSLFCETCDRLTCRDCQLQHHRDHKYQFSAEMAAQARENISSLLSKVSYKRVLLGSAMKVIRDRQQLIADKKKALVHEITQCVVKLTNAINTRGKQLVLRLNEVCDGKQRTLTEKKEALEQLAAITDHCVATVEAAIRQGSDTAVLYSKRTICSHLQRIKCSRADIPNPEIPVRISLALDKLPDLIKVLSSIGAIVVDGKVDGGAGGSLGGGGGGAGGSASSTQGPYHPPATMQTGSGGQGAPSPASSAVVALQHVAMHQSYAQNHSGGVSPVGGVSAMGAGYMNALQQQMRSRPQAAAAAALLRHQHVTSTTHPHHLHGLQEMNLRGLLNPRQNQQQQAMHHAYQQMLNSYGSASFAGNAASGPSGRRSAGSMGMFTVGTMGGAGPRTPSPAPPPHPHPHYSAATTPHQQHPHAAQHPPPAKWHIPQQNLHNGSAEHMGGMNANSIASNSGNEFKITLSRQPGPPPPGVVTSTNPKTPSPSLNGGVSSELDKVCADSVQDLMATIAKLDSNGVQVLRERSSPAPSPSVHSSTDATAPAATPAPEKGSSLEGGAVSESTGGVSGGGGTTDPNEDWCAVCLDGGELICCDKCPKVFHQYCHIPTIEKLPDETETWQCLLCVHFGQLPPEEPWPENEGPSPRQQKIMERITLELYCQYEPSLIFREPVPLYNHHYHAKISRPMCLDMIREKLQPSNTARYQHVSQFVADCRLLFTNALNYNVPESQIYKDAKYLQEFFDEQLVKLLPEYAYWSGEGEPPVKRPRLD